MTSPDAARKVLSQVFILALMLALGLVGAVLIDQARGVADMVGRAAADALALKNVELTQQTARRLAAEGQTTAAADRHAKAMQDLKALAEAEDFEPRRDRLRALTALDGDALDNGLTDIDKLRTQDLAEGQSSGGASVLQAAMLFTILSVGLTVMAGVVAFLGLRKTPSYSLDEGNRTNANQ